MKVAASVSPLHVHCHAVTTTTTTTTTSVCAAVTCLFRPYRVVVARHVWDLIYSSLGSFNLSIFSPPAAKHTESIFTPNGGSTATQPSAVRPPWERACAGGSRLMLTVKELGYLCIKGLAPAIKGK